MSFFFRPKPPPAPDPFDPLRWLERCCERLRRQYNDRAPLPQGYSPRAAGYAPDDGLSMAQLIRLFRAVRGEFAEER